MPARLPVFSSSPRRYARGVTPFVKYTLARFALFIAAFVLVWLATFWWLDVGDATIWFQALLALIISAFASIFLLRGLRDAVTERVQQRAELMQQRLEDARRAEDLD